MRVTRRRFLAASAAGLAAAAGGALHANALEAVRTERPRRPGAPPLRIALLTDVHAPHNHVDEDDLVDRVRAFDPHLVLVGGDAINRRGQESHLALYGRLPARVGRYAVFGNHEWWGRCTRESLGRAYAANDVRLLVNERATFDHEGEEIAIVGLDDWRAGRPDLDVLGAGAPWVGDLAAGTASSECPPTIVLAHCPIMFDAIQRCARSPTLVLSGHTHGGQVAPLGLALATPYGSGRYVKGWYAGSHQAQHLYVSRGIGYVGVPLRIGARPELTLLTI
ncbi:MAG TPA: metallophosphoesterase [Gemmatimonadaceae bacterium]|nr:metallophosphoesterase [Gemmatimonadaceae bacterium]